MACVWSGERLAVRLDYAAVSQAVRRFGQRPQKDAKLRASMTKIESEMSKGLLDDHRHLRAREHRKRDKSPGETLYVPHIGRKIPLTCELYHEFVQTHPPKMIASIAICAP
jgi:hypothetical protein